MGKNTRLVNIYLKIHNKKTLTIDDLAYLAEYDPECFAKTCKNVVYNIPESKPVMEPAPPEPVNVETKPEPSNHLHNIEIVLENLKRLEIDEFPVADIDTDKVKNLLGNLYMELLFPHNDKQAFMDLAEHEKKPLFDKKA